MFSNSDAGTPPTTDPPRAIQRSERGGSEGRFATVQEKVEPIQRIRRGEARSCGIRLVVRHHPVGGMTEVAGG